MFAVICSLLSQEILTGHVGHKVVNTKIKPSKRRTGKLRTKL